MTDGLEGGCLCAKVRFRTTQAPLRTIACHCTFCQQVTGSSYFAESMFPMNAVVLNAGALSSYVHISEGSRKQVFVHFCPNCGTTVSVTFERWPEIQGISRGCYDDPNAVDIQPHLDAVSTNGDGSAGRRRVLCRSPRNARRTDGAIHTLCGACHGPCEKRCLTRKT